MTRLVVPVAMIGVLSLVVTAFAGDRPPRSAGASKDARQGALERSELVIRPLAPIPPRGHAHTSPSPTDRHVAEFLRWKEQHSIPTR
jgi:hypothetical protein